MAPDGEHARYAAILHKDRPSAGRGGIPSTADGLP